VGEHIILAGRRWKIEEIDAAAKTVFVSSARGGKARSFSVPEENCHPGSTGNAGSAVRKRRPPWLNENAKLLLRAAEALR